MIDLNRLSRAHLPIGEDWKLIRAEGAGRFVSRTVHSRPDGTLHIWTSRAHRKGAQLQGRIRLWEPHESGWWISILFMIGSACFALGVIAGVVLLQAALVNAVFFAGSLFFTSAGYIQLLEAANADRRVAKTRGETELDFFRWFGWQPGQIGWLSAFVQFIGTLLFNVSTAAAMLTGLNWIQEDISIWTPDVLGCICFLIASWLAVLECCHGIAFWKMQGISWWIVMINMFGSIAFSISAVFAFIPPEATDTLNLREVNLWTFFGALSFLIGAYLLLPEMVKHSESHRLYQ